MPVIAFASPKGGVGKSTATVLLGTMIAGKDGKPPKVVIIDCDPNEGPRFWARLEGRPQSVEVLSSMLREEDGTWRVAREKDEKALEELRKTDKTRVRRIGEAEIKDVIRDVAREVPFVLVDLEGTASQMVTFSVSMADLVIIPCQASKLDGRLVAKARNMIKAVEKVAGRAIPFTVMWSRTRPTTRTRIQKDLEQQFAEKDVPLMRTELIDREAFKALFDFGGTLLSLDTAEVSGTTNAYLNARAFAMEVTDLLRELRDEGSEGEGRRVA